MNHYCTIFHVHDATLRRVPPTQEREKETTSLHMLIIYKVLYNYLEISVKYAENRCGW